LDRPSESLSLNPISYQIRGCEALLTKSELGNCRHSNMCIPLVSTNRGGGLLLIFQIAGGAYAATALKDITMSELRQFMNNSVESNFGMLDDI
jgi:hypothetical protein